VESPLSRDRPDLDELSDKTYFYAVTKTITKIGPGW
jgi:hypothetical protein